MAELNLSTIVLLVLLALTLAGIYQLEPFEIEVSDEGFSVRCLPTDR